MTRITTVVAAMLATAAAPAMAQQDPLAPLPGQPTQGAAQPATPPPATTPAPAPQRLLTEWSQILIAIDRQQWALAEASIVAMDRSHILYPYALGELYLAANSPRVSGPQAAAVVRLAPELPHAERLATLAAERGGERVSPVPARAIVSLGAAPRRTRVSSTGSELVQQLRAELEPYVEYNQGGPAEIRYREAVANEGLSGEDQAEIAHRVSWIYYVSGDFARARQIANEGFRAGRGEWRAQSAWTEGLAAWRLGDCNGASGAFRVVGEQTRDRELRSAAHYWAARAEQKCRRPQQVRPYMVAAARDGETFYGQLARARLGTDRRLDREVPLVDAAARARVERLPNVVRARALMAMGQRTRATELLRHQARIGDPGDHPALIQQAESMRLGLQYWLATNGPRGARVNAADRYPAPGWTPDNGWRIDPFLVFSHIIQESDFRETVVSPADAVGLMQVRPGTASDTARRRGQSVSANDLKRPEVNLDHGQAFLEQMRANGATRDELLRVIAAYNAGPVPVGRWAGIAGDDPLLWMESLPYWETRFYIPAILRNYFVYHAEAGTVPQALTDLVEGRAPRYPAR